LLHPWEDLIVIIDTTSHFQEETDIGLGELAILNEDLGAHHEFECGLISLEETSANIPVNFIGQALCNVVNSVLSKVGFW
jgi:hypothetical protein